MTTDSSNPPGRRAWVAPVLGGATILFVIFLLIQPFLSTLGYPAEVSAEEAAALRDQGAFILDVRPEAEWHAAHIPGSAWAPLEELERFAGSVPTRKPVVLVCGTPQACEEAYLVLRAADVPALSRLAGGFAAWEAAGLPLEASP